MAEAAEYRRYLTPQEDGQTLVDPAASRLAELVARNRAHLSHLRYDLQGRPLAELATAARCGLVAAAIRHTSQYRDVSQSAPTANRLATSPLLFSGHQPQLFHPGVWFKNFLLGQLAEEVNGIGIHLLIDSDLCRSATIRVPTGTVEQPRVETVPLDRPANDVPFEERTVVDEGTFDSFSGRAAELIRPFVEHPVVETLWPLMRGPNGREPNLGLRLAQGRHALEAQWGSETLELPQSSVCQLPEFHWFVAHLLAHLPRFSDAYNDALADYRQAHQFRNRAHPMPDLAAADGWLEAPFWLWTSDDPRRRAVFARQQSNELIVTDRGRQTLALTLSADRDATDAAEQLADWSARGVKIRTRALATTLFARLMLSDLFVHGIGGAKYDQVTDQIAQQFFGFSLPAFATASATLRLPIDHPPVGVDQWRSLRHQLRELDYHPERFLPKDNTAAGNETTGAESVLAEKRRWVETAKTSANARQRHLAIAAANAALRPLVASQRQQLLHQRERIESRLRANAILDSREYSFCLFPREHLRKHLLDGTGTTP